MKMTRPRVPAKAAAAAGMYRNRCAVWKPVIYMPIRIRPEKVRNTMRIALMPGVSSGVSGGIVAWQ
jgi:hypothetical protein